MTFRLTTSLVILIWLISGLAFSASGQEEKVLRGTQTQIDTTGKNVLKCLPIKLHKSMTINRVTGGEHGFWIEKDSKTVFKFTDNKKAVGTVLLTGTYYIYPILGKKQQEAEVEILLK